ncbi:MAG: hypothetical protein LUD01_09290 [Clostridiales bacterium]|nr:hypothetical protein [Clostridiales bacterium]
MATGFIIMIVLAVVFLSISTVIAKRFSGEGVDDFVAGGRRIPFGLVTASVMVSWVWAITVIGSSEQGMVLGISGGLNYAWGSMLPFFVFIPLVMTIRKKMPRCTTFVEFIKIRYNETLSIIFIVFAFFLTLYILLSQGMGLGVVFNTIYGMPYKLAASIPIIIVALYIANAGLKGSIVNDFIMFLIIAVIMVVTVPIILKHFGFDALYNGILDAVTNTSNPNYNPDALNLFSKSGFQYGIVCVIVCMGQILLDQGYYSKAVSTASSKSLLLAYIIGTIFAWMPIPILCGNVLGGAGLSLGLDTTLLSSTSDVAPYIYKLVFGGGVGSIMFILMIFMAGLSTGGDILAGAQAICTVDIYKKYIKKDATEAQQKRFGKVMTLVIGFFMAVVVMFFEGRSLVSIDVLTGIVFASPCAAFILGVFWKKASPKIATASIFIGIATGVITYVLIGNADINYVVGNICSLAVPFAVIIIGSLFTNYEFDFKKLAEYTPDHKVNV